MQIVTGRRGEPHVTSRQMQAVYRSFLGDFALLDIGEKLRAEAYSNDIVRVYDGVVSVQGIYAVIAYNQYDEVYIEPVSVGKKRIDTIVLHYTKDNALDVEDMQLDVVHGEEYTDNPIAPVVPEGGDAWEGTTDIQVPIYDVEVTNFGLTVTPYARMLNLIPTLESIAERIPETVVTGVKGDSEVLYRDGDVNITKANIGLGNVDNTADTDKPISTATQTALNLKADLVYVNAVVASAYHAGGNLTVAELTSALLIADNMGKVYNMSDSGVTTSDFVEGAGEPINKGDNVGICNVGTEESPVYKFDLLSGFVDLSAYATTSAVNTGLAGKVDKVTGKGLSTNDYTTADKNKLTGIEAEANKTVVDSAMSDSSTNPVQNKVITKELEGSKTATGNPLTIEDAAPVNAVNLSMDLEPIQDLHGYDHPWVGGAGKNILPMTVEGIKSANTSGTWSGNDYTINGVTFTIQTDSDGNVTGINANGTASDTIAFILAESVSATQNCILTGGKSATMCIQSRYTTQPFNWVPDNGSPNGTVVPMERPRFIFIYIDNSTSVNSQLFKPMIRLSTETDSSYAPYTNYASISGRSEVAIQRVGKNLFGGLDFANALHAKSDYGTIDTTNKTVSFNRTSNYSPIFEYPFKENTQYTFIYSGNTESANQRNTSILFEYTDGTESAAIDLSSNIKGTYAIQSTSGKTIKSIDLRWANGANAVLYYDECGLFEGALTTSDFEPYAGKTYTIQIGQDVYGAQYDVTRGKMVVTHGEVDLGDLSWTFANTGNKYFYSLIDNMKYVSPNGVCSCYNRNTTYGEASTVLNNGDFNTVIYRNYLYVRDDRYSDATAFKTAVTGQTLVYELATPYTIQLTPQQINLLENTNTIYTDYEGDTIKIEYQPNNAIGEAVRAVEESYDPEFAVRPVLKKKAFSGTTDTDGAVTLINASDIPSGHKIIPLHITDMTIGGSAGTYFVEYESYNSGDSVKGYCYAYFNGSQITPVGSAVTGNFYYYDLEV